MTAQQRMLQRALLDAAAILSAAADIARRAAILSATSSESAAQVQKATGHGTARPWPSHTLASVVHTPSTSTSSSSLPPAPSSNIASVPESQIASRDGIEERPWPSRASRPPRPTPTTADRSPLSGVPVPDGKLEMRTTEEPRRAANWEQEAKGLLSDRVPAADETHERHIYRTESKGRAISETESETSPSSTIDSKAKYQIEGQKIVVGSPKIHKEMPLGSAAAATTAMPDFDPPVELDEYDATKQNKTTPLRAAKVPSSRIARLLHYGSLGAGLAWGSASSYLGGGGGSSEAKTEGFMSDDNVRRLVDKLSTMRGAALKLGQFMSIQETNMLPKQVEEVMLRVQNSANYMPVWQMEQVMRQDLGAQWRDAFDDFDEVPFAAASIGQVHVATLSKSHPTNPGLRVAVKVQFPGVRESIGSDLSNLRWLVSASALLPKGLFLDNTIRVMRRELDDECDYEREAEMGARFAQLLNRPDSNFAVPRVIKDLCSKRILTTEMMKGRPLTQASRFSQEKRDDIARKILELSLRELFEFRLMQTDPNWTNFLYNERTRKIELIDFGATREYDKDFIDDWLCMLRAAIGGRYDECVEWSRKVGYLTGEESPEMEKAHVDSMVALGEPFRQDAPDPYLFENQTITARVRAQIPLMLRQRLTAPPEPTYSLNRKLSGAFLLCARLKARIGCRTMMDDVTQGYVLSNANSGFNEGTTVPTAAAAFPRTSASLGNAATTRTRNFHTSSVRQQKQSSQPAASLGQEIRRVRHRQRLGNLADRWPKHIAEAIVKQIPIEQSTTARPDQQVFSLASEPASPSMASTPSQSASPTPQIPLETKQSPAEQPLQNSSSQSTSAAHIDDKASRIFIRGVAVPRKPEPPGPEDCCMSGCARCVYDLYAESLQDYHEDLTAARRTLQSQLHGASEYDTWWDVELLGPRPASEEGNKGAGGVLTKEEAEDKAQREVDDVIGGLDPTMKAFLTLERSLKKANKGKAASET